MNILFIGPYHQSDEWGKISRDYIKSIDTLDHNLVIRPIYLSQHPTVQLEEQLIKLQNNHCDNYDIIIQHTLPPFFGHNTEIEYNILLCPMETFVQKHDVHPWFNYLDNINYILTPTTYDLTNLTTILKQPTQINTIDIPIDPNILEYEDTLDLSDNDFLFYFMGDNSDYYNLDDLIIAFHTEFDSNEPVNLLIYTPTPQDTINKINSIKEKLHKYQNLSDYKHEIIVQNQGSYDFETLVKIHNTANCLVCPYRGNTENIRTIEAKIFNNEVINNFTDEYNHPLIEPIVTYECPIEDFYTCYNSWCKLDIQDLQNQLRSEFDYHANLDYNIYKKPNLDIFNQHSYQTIGQNIQKALDAIIK